VRFPKGLFVEGQERLERLFHRLLAMKQRLCVCVSRNQQPGGLQVAPGAVQLCACFLMPQLAGSHRAACLRVPRWPAVKREHAPRGHRNRCCATAQYLSGNPCRAAGCKCRHLEAVRRASRRKLQRRNPGRCRDLRHRGLRSRKGRYAPDGSTPRAGLQSRRWLRPASSYFHYASTRGPCQRHIATVET
jgi:hypothetical protein